MVYKWVSLSSFSQLVIFYAIGNYQGGRQLFAESIDDIQVHSRALTAEEIINIADNVVVT